MFDLFAAATPNGRKISMLLEDLGLSSKNLSVFILNQIKVGPK